jgi:hypothetical protein
VQITPTRPTVLVVVAELSVVSGSLVVDETVAVFEITVASTVPAFTLTISANVALPPDASEGAVQFTEPVAPTAGVVHVHPATGASETKVVLAARVSLRATLEAASGPVLLTAIEYVRFAPAVTGSGESVFVTATSAPVPAIVVVVVVAELSDGSVSAVSDVTVAVFETTVPAAVPALTFTTNVNVPLPPAASDADVLLTVPVPPTAGVVELHPAGAVSETNVAAAGVTSVSATLAAASGPSLLTTIV